LTGSAKAENGNGAGFAVLAAGLLVTTSMLGFGTLALWSVILADRIGIQHAFILPVVCCVFIAYYGFRGSRPGMTIGAGA
jgi:fucose permease